MAEIDLDRSRYLLEVFNLADGGAYSSMHAEDLRVGGLVVDHSSERHHIEQVIDLVEDAVGIVDVLTKSFLALLTESEVLVHSSIFMIASEEEDLLWVLQFERHE